MEAAEVPVSLIVDLAPDMFFPLRSSLAGR